MRRKLLSLLLVFALAIPAYASDIIIDDTGESYEAEIISESDNMDAIDNNEIIIDDGNNSVENNMVIAEEDTVNAISDESEQNAVIEEAPIEDEIIEKNIDVDSEISETSEEEGVIKAAAVSATLDGHEYVGNPPPIAGQKCLHTYEKRLELYSGDTLVFSLPKGTPYWYEDGITWKNHADNPLKLVFTTSADREEKLVCCTLYKTFNAESVTFDDYVFRITVYKDLLSRGDRFVYNVNCSGKLKIEPAYMVSELYPMTYTWMHDGNVIGKNRVLNIKNVRESGKYKLILDTGYQTLSKEYIVNVTSTEHECEWKTERKASVFSEGKKIKKCKVCNAIVETKPIPKIKPYLKLSKNTVTKKKRSLKSDCKYSVKVFYGKGDEIVKAVATNKKLATVNYYNTNDTFGWITGKVKSVKFKKGQKSVSTTIAVKLKSGLVKKIKVTLYNR